MGCHRSLSIPGTLLAAVHCRGDPVGLRFTKKNQSRRSRSRERAEDQEERDEDPKEESSLLTSPKSKCCHWKRRTRTQKMRSSRLFWTPPQFKCRDRRHWKMTRTQKMRRRHHSTPL